MSDQACETPMSDHVARFWHTLATDHVRILVDIRRDHDEGLPPHWDSASFSDDVAKALIADRQPKPSDDVLVRQLRELATDFAIDNKTDLKQHVCWIAADRLSRAPAQPTRSSVLEEAARVAEQGCLVPPDGGSPTEAEADLCQEIASRIRLLKLKGAETVFAAQPPAAPVETETEGELVVTQYELAAARTALREIADLGGKITDPKNTYGIQMTNIAVGLLDDQGLLTEQGVPQCSAGNEGQKNWPFQKRVLEWLMACFSMEICRDGVERNHRFLEEALELVQSLGCTRSEAHQLVDYVFDRPIGEPMQELGGVQVTLAALCFPHDLDMNEAAERELARVWTKIDKIRAKQAAKPKHSPLPEHVSDEPQGVCK